MFDDNDSEFGYSLNELAHSYSKKAYKIPDYDINSMNEIEQCLQNCNYADKFQCIGHLQFLEDMEKRLSLISLAEAREGMMNWEVREVLGRARELATRLENFSEIFSHSADAMVI